MATFQLELVSPEQLLLSRPVEMAIIPAAEGEMGVLPGHAPMIVALARRRDPGAGERRRRPRSCSSAAASPRSRRTASPCWPMRRRRWPACRAPRPSAALAEAEAALRDVPLTDTGAEARCRHGPGAGPARQRSRPPRRPDLAARPTPSATAGIVAPHRGARGHRRLNPPRCLPNIARHGRVVRTIARCAGRRRITAASRPRGCDEALAYRSGGLGPLRSVARSTPRSSRWSRPRRWSSGTAATTPSTSTASSATTPTSARPPTIGRWRRSSTATRSAAGPALADPGWDYARRPSPATAPATRSTSMPTPRSAAPAPAS